MQEIKDYEEAMERWHGNSPDESAPDPDAKREAEIQAAWDSYEAARTAKRRKEAAADPDENGCIWGFIESGDLSALAKVLPK